MDIEIVAKLDSNDTSLAIFYQNGLRTLAVTHKSLYCVFEPDDASLESFAKLARRMTNTKPNKDATNHGKFNFVLGDNQTAIPKLVEVVEFTMRCDPDVDNNIYIEITITGKDGDRHIPMIVGIPEFNAFIDAVTNFDPESLPYIGPNKSMIGSPNVSNRGFGRVGWTDVDGYHCQLKESSRMGNHDENPGAAFLMFSLDLAMGDSATFMMSRKMAKEYVNRIVNWIDTGKLDVDDPRVK